MTSDYKNTITILGQEIPLGASATLNFNIAKLHTATQIEVPIIVERSKTPGPTLLFSAGIHGDEINGVDIVRQLIAKKINKPKRGTIICMPIINIFGFLNSKRAFPDGRDLNRVFPGFPNGSLASRVAHRLVNEVLPDVDMVVDFHTGGASRFNAAQIRIVREQPELEALAKVFGPPFVLYSNLIAKSFRSTCQQLGKPILLYEGGKSFYVDNHISKVGVEGAKRILAHYDMLHYKVKAHPPKRASIFVEESKWLRAKHSGMFKALVAIDAHVKCGEVLGQITDPYGTVHHEVTSTVDGYIINVNEASLVYQGDALFHVTTRVGG